MDAYFAHTAHIRAICAGLGALLTPIIALFVWLPAIHRQNPQCRICGDAPCRQNIPPSYIELMCAALMCVAAGAIYGALFELFAIAAVLNHIDKHSSRNLLK